MPTTHHCTQEGCRAYLLAAALVEDFLKVFGAGNLLYTFVKKRSFWLSSATLEKSKDLADNLPALVNFLKKYTGATGVYVGRLQHPELQIAVDADDKAHLDYEAAKVIKFIHASEDHEFVEGALL